jgi:carboxymethylenebutenolidase
MGEMIELTASDGHKLTAYEARPQGIPRGGLVVGQELFGVNVHIKAVADSYAADGYVAVAPQFYDRVRPGFAVGYSDAERIEAFGVLQGLDKAKAALDVQAVLDHLKPHGKAGMVGYCSGGSMAWYCATQLPDLACAVSYYGGWIAGMAEDKPLCPVMLHWGEIDHTIPLADVEKVQAARPEVISFVYPDAPHGFNCDMRAFYHPPSAALSRERTLGFLRQYVG